MPINFDILVVVYNTDAGEAFEFVKGYIWIFILVFLVYNLIYWQLIRSLPRKVPFKSSLFISLSAVVFFAILALVINKNGLPDFSKIKENVTATYPGSLLYAISSFNQRLNAMEAQEENVKRFKFNGTQRQELKDREIYIMIIGESSRVKSWQIYGYSRATSPRLAAKNDSLIKFSNMISGGYITALAVPLLVTRATPDNYNLHYAEKSVVSAFKESGFKTYWLSNQTDFKDIEMHARESDEAVYLPSSFTFGKNVKMDMELVPIFEKVIAKGEKKVFIVLHMLGSHYDYAARYPDEYDKFKPSLKTVRVNPTDYSKRQYMINGYDNSVLYSDAVISNIIDIVQKTNAISTVTFISDHGEDLFDDDRKLSQHINPVPSEYIAHVPFFIWRSNKYDSTFKNKVSNLIQNKDKGIGSQNIFYTLLDMSDLRYPDMDTTKSVASSSFKNGVQRIIGGGAKIYDIDALKYPKLPK